MKFIPVQRWSTLGEQTSFIYKYIIPACFCWQSRWSFQPAVLPYLTGKHQQNIEIFEDTREWYTRGAKLKLAVQRSRQGTQFYAPGELALPAETLARFAADTRVLVSRERTLQAAGKYAGQRVAVLNFASATNPGGGVTRGSSAQEETLCRCSTLYPCLLGDEPWQKYYKMRRDRHDVTYTDARIYTPDVLIIKTDTDVPERLPDKMQAVDVITCATPNLREHPSNAINPGFGSPVHLSRQDIYSLHTQRTRKILNVAALHDIDVLILGAFGCGAFCNPPDVVADACRDVLPEFAHALRTVEFAVYRSPKDDRFQLPRPFTAHWGNSHDFNDFPKPPTAKRCRRLLFFQNNI